MKDLRLSVQEGYVVDADGRTRPLPDELVDVMETGELDEVEVHLFFKGGEMWAAVNVLARERSVSVQGAFAATLAVGLTAMGYDVGFPSL